jgi:hypothetical protein
LVKQQEFSDLKTIKAVFAVLFPSNTDLNHALAQRDLWMLYQRRNLVVHRRGVIDQAYLDATGEILTTGTRLVVSPEAFEIAVRVVVSAATAVAHCITSGIAFFQKGRRPSGGSDEALVSTPEKQKGPMVER